MQPNIEQIGALERRVDLSVSKAEIAAEVAQRLARLARDTSMPGFRRGKVPMKMVAQAHGAQVQAEVLSDKVGSALSQALDAGRVRMAGRPRIEAVPDADPATQGFRATFEVYPEVGAPDVSALAVTRAVCPVGEAEIDKTIDIMRRQRAVFTAVQRPAADGDRVHIDFRGTIDDVAFPGGTASGYAFELGRGRMLPEFEAAIRGAAPGASVEATVHFPADYHGKEVAGRTARFAIDVRAVEQGEPAPLDADFARAVGIADGDLESLRAEVRANVEREVGTRLRARTRDSVMEALLSVAGFELPRTLVLEEQEQLHQMAQAQIEARGGTAAPDSAVFAEAAQRRVRLSLLLAEIVRTQNLQARQDQVRGAVEAIARGYEKPAEVVQWYLGNRERLAEIEAGVVEDNVIEWILQRARVTDQPVPFDELMDQGARRQ